MAQLVSKELGDEEVDDTRENYSYGANSIRDGISLGKNRMTRPIVTYPEIMNMDALTCYLRLPGNYPITQLKLIHKKRRQQAAGFIQRACSVVLETTVASLEARPAQSSSDASSTEDMLSTRPLKAIDEHELETDSLL